MNRYYNTQKIINNADRDKALMDKKNIKNILQYSIYDFGTLGSDNKLNLDITYHTFERGDKLYNIAQKYYNDASLGWLICYTNNISNELQILEGQMLSIYLPLENLLELLNGISR